MLKLRVILKQLRAYVSSIKYKKCIPYTRFSNHFLDFHEDLPGTSFPFFPILQHLVETFSSKWRVSAKENEVHYCAHLLAQCLVQEKILGFSIYSGFISKEHEMLLEGSRAHLIEVEKKATKAVLKIGKLVWKNLLTQIRIFQ